MAPRQTTAVWALLAGHCNPSLVVSVCSPEWTHVWWNHQLPAPAPVSGPSPTVHFVNSDPFALHASPPFSARGCSVLSDPNRHLCPLSLRSATVTTGAASAPAEASPPFLASMRHVTHQLDEAPTVDEATCSLFTAIERVTCTAPAFGGLWELGSATVVVRCQARPPRVGDIIMPPWRACQRRGHDDGTLTLLLHPASPLTSLPLTIRPTSRSASAHFPQRTILHVPASCRLRIITWHGAGTHGSGAR